MTSFLLIIFSTFIATAERPPLPLADECKEEPQPISRVADERKAKFFLWAEQHYGKGGAPFDMGSDGGPYIVDLNNDGVDKYLMTAHQGTAHIFYGFAYQKEGVAFNEWRNLPHHEKTSFFSEEYVNPVFGREEIVTKACGHIYLNFGYQTFLWVKSSLKQVCDDTWFSQRRALFQSLYKNEEFEKAHQFLEGTLNACSQGISNDLRLWALSDLALSASKMNAPNTCKQHIDKAKAMKEYAVAPAKLKESIEFNLKHCDGPMTNALDLSWLGEYDHKSTNSVVWDKRFQALILEAVPDAKIDRENLRDIVRDNLGGPPDNAELTQGRYLILSACRHSSCGDKGFAWVDTKENKIIFLVAPIRHEGVSGRAVVSSVGFSKDKLPGEFWRAYKAWALRKHLEVSGFQFVNAKGSSETLTVDPSVLSLHRRK